MCGGRTKCGQVLVLKGFPLNVQPLCPCGVGAVLYALYKAASGDTYGHHFPPYIDGTKGGFCWGI